MIALDTNVLVYAEQPVDGSQRAEVARHIFGRLQMIDAIIPLQVMAEFFNVSRRKLKLPLGRAEAVVRLLQRSFICPATLPDDLLAAAALADRYQLSYFDALICAVSRRVGATVLLSEDMADGMEVAGLRIVDPFNLTNAALIEGLLKV